MAIVKIIGEALENGASSFIKKTEVSAPFSTIQNRAKINSSLQAIMGSERLHVNSLNKLLKESGPNGETVYEPDSGDARVRFVGAGWTTDFGTYGTYVNATISQLGSYAEVTFYGTGLNVFIGIDGNPRPFDVSIDGGATTSFDSNGSTVLGGRNYKSNTIRKLFSNETLGWHTVKIENTSALSIFLFGFEVVDESSQITIKGGTAFAAGEELTIVDQLIDYKLGFDNIADINVGTIGGRAVIYADTDGTIKKRLTKVDAAPAYLALTDHTNEAPYRVINFREFGRNRGDDFSTLTSGSWVDRAFTLDDDTTTLLANNVRSDFAGGVRLQETSGFMAITFVGTGLDVTRNSTSAAGASDADVTDIYVDGVNKGPSQASTGGVDEIITVPVCSGLPYGTHTVKWALTTEGMADIRYFDFIVYQSKKPTLPENVLEIAEYNIIADYVAVSGTTVDDNMEVPSGTLAKFALREFSYPSGTWSANTGAFDMLNPSGWQVGSTTAASYCEFTFFGTGVNMLFRGTTNTNIAQMSIDGVVDNSGTDLVNTTNNGDGTYTFAGVSNLPRRVAFTGLSLGLHTIRVTRVSGTQSLQNVAAYVLTPIHSPHTTFGSKSLKDLRNFDSGKSINKEVKEKESFCYKEGNANVILSSKNISQVLEVALGRWHVFFEEPLFDNKGSGQSSGLATSRFSAVYEIHKHRFETNCQNSSGVYDGWGFNAKILSKLEKDELEE